MTGSRGAAVAAALSTPGGRPPLRGSDLPAAVTLDAGIAWADGVIDIVDASGLRATPLQAAGVPA